MTLQEYMDKEGVSAVNMARKIRCSRQQIYNYADGTNLPSLKVAARIEEETNGAVTLYDWVIKEKKVVKSLDKLSDLL